MKYLKLVVFLLTFSAYSQNIELKWADKIKTKDKFLF